jgi:hypothetical protein
VPARNAHDLAGKTSTPIPTDVHTVQEGERGMKHARSLQTPAGKWDSLEHTFRQQFSPEIAVPVVIRSPGKRNGFIIIAGFVLQSAAPDNV